MNTEITTEELKSRLRAEILQEIADDKINSASQTKEEHENTVKYVSIMKQSSEPWVDIRGIGIDDEKGVKIELDWNDAFVAHLRSEGVSGADEDQVVQKWLAMLSQNIMRPPETEYGESSEFL